MTKNSRRRGAELRRWGPIALAVFASAVAAAAQVPQVAPPPSTPVPTSLVPRVTDWTPRDKGYPGQILVIRGRDFRPEDFQVKLGSGTQATTLTIVSGTSTEIRARIPQGTVPEGLPLTVSYSTSTGTPAELTPRFKVIPRDAVFSGPSLWHTADSTTSDIFTRGTVTLRLELFEFAESGEGAYQETVNLVRLVRKFEEDCKTSVGLGGKRDVELWDFQAQRPNRRITWNRLPDGRIEIRDVGVMPMTVVATLFRQSLAAQLTTTAAGPYTRRTESRSSDCRLLARSTSTSGAQGILALPTPEPPPLVGVDFRRVQWSLARSGS